MPINYNYDDLRATHVCFILQFPFSTTFCVSFIFHNFLLRRISNSIGLAIRAHGENIIIMIKANNEITRQSNWIIVIFISVIALDAFVLVQLQKLDFCSICVYFSLSQEREMERFSGNLLFCCWLFICVNSIRLWLFAVYRISFTADFVFVVLFVIFSLILFLQFFLAWLEPINIL